MKKLITGSWFEFRHSGAPEGKYWNDTIHNFTEEQWREKVREMHEIGMKYIVLMSTALEYKTYYPSKILKDRWDTACAEPVEVLLDECDKLGMKVFVGNGFYDNWRETINNMTDPRVQKLTLAGMNELAEQFGHHKSFYGWYYSDESRIRGNISKEFLDYVNLCSAEAHKLGNHFKTLIAPYGTRDVIENDDYVRSLEAMDIDFVAYQDEIGVQKTQLCESEGFYAALKRMHDKAGRGKLWADVEVFEFKEGPVYQSALTPAPIERIKAQLDAVAPYVDEILIYQYMGLMSKPGSIAFAGHESAAQLYNDYVKYTKE